MKPLTILISTLCLVGLLAVVYATSRAQAAVGIGRGIQGARCTIQFRRDALGAAAPIPVSPMTGNINGADVSTSGTFSRMHEDWVIIERGGNEVWIPRAVVLSLQFESK